jgi:hypothetical protein
MGLFWDEKWKRFGLIIRAGTGTRPYTGLCPRNTPGNRRGIPNE